MKTIERWVLSGTSVAYALRSTSLSKLAKPLPALASSSPLASSIAIEDFSPCGGWASNGP
ncbi:MAG TPA: hypothetical protein VNO32_50695 [Candidatus Acidoferrum sp.]|nr:hypothetical protein [Candidatus Acidoferrum sp.]